MTAVKVKVCTDHLRKCDHGDHCYRAGEDIQAINRYKA